MTLFVRPYVKDGIELDTIAVEGVRVAGTHGVLATERETGQLFYADIVVHVNTRSAARVDDLQRSVDYSRIADAAAEVLAGDPANLIETVANHIARRVLEMDGVECVDVIVHKPQAPLHVEFKDVAVQIRRDMRSGDLWADRRIGSAARVVDDPLDPGAPAAPTDLFDQRPPSAVGAIIALGGNLGDVEQTLTDAVFMLARVRGIELVSTSPLVRTKAVGGPEQPDFHNAVARISTTLAPRELLFACQGIEMVHGRERDVANGPRTLDLDIVAYGDVTGMSRDLSLPHPRAHERAFVLAPWAAMEPDAVLPGTVGGRVADLAARAADRDGLTLVRNPWPAPDSKPTPVPTV